jgi:uncharacterized protein
MLIMLAFGVPLYICATASTPIAAALILKGVSPGAALVFLMAGPATNIAALTVILAILGRRATAIYLTVIALGATLFGLITDRLYEALGWSAQALAGGHSEILPVWLKVAAAFILVLLSLPVLAMRLRHLWERLFPNEAKGHPAAGAPCSADNTPLPPGGT